MTAAGKSKTQKAETPPEPIEETKVVEISASEAIKKLKPSLGIKKTLTIAVVVLVIAGLAGSSLYFYSQYQQTQKLVRGSSSAQNNEAEQLAQAVGKLFLLPSSEKPTIATVTDKAKLASQPFFSRAENGDKVLIFTNAKVAVLYRPSMNRIIQIAPVNNDVQQTAQVSGASTTALSPSLTPAPSQSTQEYTVSIYNGTTISGLAAKVETSLQGNKGIKVVEKGNASTNDYDKTIVVDVTGTHKDVAEQLANEINGTVQNLPNGEQKPSADLLIIAGKDFAGK